MMDKCVNTHNSWNISMERDAINLTLVHEWMTVSDAKLLLEDHFQKIKEYKKYHGWSTVQTLMDIAYGIWQRESEEQLQVRIDLIKSRV